MWIRTVRIFNKQNNFIQQIFDKSIQGLVKQHEIFIADKISIVVKNEKLSKIFKCGHVKNKSD